MGWLGEAFIRPGESEKLSDKKDVLLQQMEMNFNRRLKV
jgi:hypothetical protein